MCSTLPNGKPIGISIAGEQLSSPVTGIGNTSGLLPSGIYDINSVVKGRHAVISEVKHTAKLVSIH